MCCVIPQRPDDGSGWKCTFDEETKCGCALFCRGLTVLGFIDLWAAPRNVPPSAAQAPLLAQRGDQGVHLDRERPVDARTDAPECLIFLPSAAPWGRRPPRLTPALRPAPLAFSPTLRSRPRSLRGSTLCTRRSSKRPAAPCSVGGAAKGWLTAQAASRLVVRDLRPTFAHCTRPATTPSGFCATVSTARTGGSTTRRAQEAVVEQIPADAGISCEWGGEVDGKAGHPPPPATQRQTQPDPLTFRFDSAAASIA